MTHPYLVTYNLGGKGCAQRFKFKASALKFVQLAMGIRPNIQYYIYNLTQE